MTEYNTIDLSEGVKIEDRVSDRIKHVGIKGFSIDKAKELGVFTRISYLLTAIHTTIRTANRIYGNVTALLDSFGGRRNEIAKAHSDMETAYDKYLRFWSGYYSNDKDAVQSSNDESEKLYHNVMKWAQLPEFWGLGDEQCLNDDTDVVLKVDDADRDKILRFYKTIINEEILESSDYWCVTKYDTHIQQQVCVEDNMDKASAMMVAKRLSTEDPENIYTASQVTDVKKTETIITPYKAYKNNSVVSTINKILK